LFHPTKRNYYNKGVFNAHQSTLGCINDFNRKIGQQLNVLANVRLTNGFSGHDLRRTFATFVTMASHDEFLAMQLMRDRVPGLGDRYIRYPMDKLVEALEKYSPIRQAKESSQKNCIIDGDRQKDSGAVKPSVVSGAGQSLKIKTVDTIKEFGGDGGESNSPSKRSCPGLTTSLVSSFISPDSPQLTELNRTSR
jgi:hypothetical protein